MSDCRKPVTGERWRYGNQICCRGGRAGAGGAVESLTDSSL